MAQGSEFGDAIATFALHEHSHEHDADARSKAERAKRIGAPSAPPALAADGEEKEAPIDHIGMVERLAPREGLWSFEHAHRAQSKDGGVARAATKTDV